MLWQLICTSCVSCDIMRNLRGIAWITWVPQVVFCFFQSQFWSMWWWWMSVQWESCGDAWVCNESGSFEYGMNENPCECAMIEDPLSMRWIRILWVCNEWESFDYITNQDPLRCNEWGSLSMQCEAVSVFREPSSHHSLTFTRVQRGIFDNCIS